MIWRGGLRIAGTGTIAPDGQVGAVGGVAQKVAAAERAGTDYFLVPQANAADARRAARTVEVLAVATVADALAVLESCTSGGEPWVAGIQVSEVCSAR